MARVNLGRRVLGVLVVLVLGRSIALRSLALTSARLAGAFGCWIASGWRKLFLLYATAATLILVHRFVTDPSPAQRWQALRTQPSVTSLGVMRWFFHGAIGPWVAAIALAALISATFAAWRVRRRLVILSFANLSGEYTWKGLADSIPRRLMTEISEITEIYSQVSDDPADLILDSGKGMSPELAVDGPTAFFSALKASVKDQKVQLGPLSIPLDASFTTLSTLLQGPQLTGSLQKTADGPLIECSLSGGGWQQTWRVAEIDLEPEPAMDSKTAVADGMIRQTAVADGMIRQLAYRVFTHVAQDVLGTPRWRAAVQYTEALRAFRQARDQKDTSKRALSLQKAQQGFFKAYREDSQFVRSRYNLGVIYLSQGQSQPAYEVFRAVINDSAATAISAPPWRSAFNRARRDLASAHYAAAKAAQGLGDLYKKQAQHHCKMAIQIDPWHAQALNLSGVIRFTDLPTSQTRPYFRRAIAFSWFELCAAEWTGKSKTITLLRAVTHLANLASSHVGGKRSLRVMAQALRLQPSRADKWCELGELYLALDQPKRALAAFDDANREGERPFYWVWIACTNRLMDRKKDAAQEAWDRAKEFVNDDLFQKNGIKEVWTAFGNVIGRGHLRLPDLQDWQEESLQLVNRLAQLNAAGDEIIDQKTPRVLVQELTGKSDAADTPDDTGTLKLMVDWMSANGSEMAARQLLPFVARRKLKDWEEQTPQLLPANLDDSLGWVVKALRARPVGVRERSLLTRAYLLLKLLELAADEVSIALSLEPGNEDIKLLAVGVAQGIFSTVTDRQVRLAALRRMMHVFGDLAAGARGDFWTVDSRRTEIGWTHFWLARFAVELLDFPTAQKGFETSFYCRYKPFESLAYLCLVHYLFDAFEEAESAYRRLNEFVPTDKPEAMLQLTGELKYLGEEKPPAHWFAWASNHTAAAMAEQGLVFQAIQRWKTARKWKRTLQASPTGLDKDDERLFAAGLALCWGAILLSAGRKPFPVKPFDRRPRCLRRAIKLFTRTIEFAIDSAIRAEALYRTADACAELVQREAGIAATWRARGLDALRRAEAADRRDQFAARIQQLRQTLG